MLGSYEGERNMKKVISIFGIIFALFFSGCTLTKARVDTLVDWSFQYNENTNDYSLFFGFTDKNNKPLASAATVDIRIVNDADEVVYSGTKNVSVNDFSTYSNKVKGERYLANIRISESEITAGKSSHGKVYLSVYQPNEFMFDEVNCEVLLGLPLKDIDVKFDTFPLNVNSYGPFSEISSVIQIQSVEYKYLKDSTPSINITVYGEKLSGSEDMFYDIIGYKLIDSAGYTTDSGTLMLSSLQIGEKFKDTTISFYNVIPGETYTLQFFEKNM